MQNGDNWGIFSSHTKYKRTHMDGDDTLRKKIGLSRANKKTHQEGKVNCSLFPGFIACVLNTISFLRWKCSGFLLGNPFLCGIYPIKYKWWCEHEAYSPSYWTVNIWENVHQEIHNSMHRKQLNFSFGYVCLSQSLLPMNVYTWEPSAFLECM